MPRLDKLILTTISAFALVFAVAPDANAQKASAPSVPKAKAPKAKSAKTAKPATKTPAKTAAKTARKPKKKKTASACKGLKKTACGGKKQCGWITPKKKVDKRGRKLTAYCRKVAGIAKSKGKTAKAVAKSTPKASTSAKAKPKEELMVSKSGSPGASDDPGHIGGHKF